MTIEVLPPPIARPSTETAPPAPQGLTDEELKKALSLEKGWQKAEEHRRWNGTLWHDIDNSLFSLYNRLTTIVFCPKKGKK